MSTASRGKQTVDEIIGAAQDNAASQLELDGRLHRMLDGIQRHVGPGLLHAGVWVRETGIRVPRASVGVSMDWALELDNAIAHEAVSGDFGQVETGVRLVVDDSCNHPDGEELARKIVDVAEEFAAEHYSDPLGKLRILLEQARDPVGRMATASAHFHNIFRKYTWVGFYMLAEEPDVLRIGPYCGFPTCTASIPVQRGMCGRSFSENRVLNIPDITKAEGYIACHGSTISELVIPVRENGRPIGVFDLDSDIRGAFTTEDEELLSRALDLVFPQNG
jgi:GAF domain-containing protein